MQSKRNTTTASDYHGYPILTGKKNDLPVDASSLERIEKQFDFALDSKSKVLFYRFDLHFPNDMQIPLDNEHFRKFISAYAKNLSRKGLEPQYVAVREQRKSEHQHYHVGMLLDGQKTRSPYEHLKTADRLWAHELGLQTDNPSALGLVNHCDRDRDGNLMKNGMMIDPTKDDYEIVRDRCFQRASYLAKTSQKNTPKGSREFFASKLPEGYRQ